MKMTGWVLAGVLGFLVVGCSQTTQTASTSEATSEPRAYSSNSFGAGDSLGSHLHSTRREEAPRTDFASLDRD